MRLIHIARGVSLLQQGSQAEAISLTRQVSVKDLVRGAPQGVHRICRGCGDLPVAALRQSFCFSIVGTGHPPLPPQSGAFVGPGVT